MTVGIAAICEGGKSIVMAADRLVTVGEGDITVEAASKKIIKLTPQAWMTITGTIQECEYVQEIVGRTGDSFDDHSVYRIARRLRKGCENIRARQIEEQITRPMLKVSFAKFGELCNKSIESEAIKDVWKCVLNFRFALEMLICGFDPEPHIYRVTHSTLNSHEAIGFTAIGIGRTMATVTLAIRGKSFLNRPVAETMYHVYEAKRTSESTGLVGRRTDMLLIRQGSKATFLPKDLVRSLRRIVKKQKPPKLSADELSDINSKLPPQSTP